MNNKKLMYIGLTMILVIPVLAMFTAVASADDPPCTCGDICVNQTGWWRDGSAFNASNTPIQHAIDNASAGNTICVKDGTYNENVDVDKRLTIRSENGSASTSVRAASSHDYVFEVTADYVNISGFHVTDVTMAASGIYLYDANYCNISDNNANENNYHGIFLNSSSDNTLVNNSALGNSDYGIYLSSSSNNNLVNNTMTGNGFTFGVSGSTLSHFIQNIDTSNTVDGKPIYYWVDQQNRAIPNDAGYVGVVNSTNITVRDLTLTKNGEGVLFAYTGDSIIENVIVSNNYMGGIYLYSSCNNNITSNTASASQNMYYGSGIHLNYSSNNTLTDNTASDNFFGIYLEDSSYNTLSDNNGNLNKGIGIWLWSSSHNTLSDNNGDLNEAIGIYLEDSSYNTLTNNTANSNCFLRAWPHPGMGIALYQSSYNELKDNIANWNCMKGIILSSSSNHNTLSDNTASHNDNDGICLVSSNNNALTNNNANSNNESGIYLYLDSNNNYLVNNTASENKVDGFKLGSNSSHNRIIGNNASDNDKNGIRLYGTTGNPSSHNTVANNTADFNDKSGIMIEGADSDHNTIVNNTCKSNDYGISVRYGDYNNLTNNTCNQNTEYGIRLYQSADYNEITNNTAESNEHGIYLKDSGDNLIYNNYFNNTNNAWDNGNNIWNTTKTAGTNIIGGPYLGGNYWSDYAGIDTSGDGLGDTLIPYNCSGNITTGGDWHPLTSVGPNITSFAPPSPVNDTVCTWTTFNVTVNQTVNVSWYLNGSLLPGTNVSITEANYTLHAEFVGDNNVSAVATNANGTNMQTWIWNVTAPLVLNCTCGDICVNTTGWWRDGGDFYASNTPIQHAINNATVGETICVKDGTYNENVEVNKRLTIRSTSGDSANTIVNASNPNDHVFEITVDYVNISGFTVKGAVGLEKAGIYLGNEVNHCNITNNTMKSNYYGIHLGNADNNNITCNWVAHNDACGFYLAGGSTGNNVSLNNIMSNGEPQGGGVYHWNFYNNQTDAVDAKNNYWVAAENETIDASIYDDNEGKGKVTFYPFESEAVPCAPIPELPTIVLFSVGLLALVGYLRIRVIAQYPVVLNSRDRKLY